MASWDVLTPMTGLGKFRILLGGIIVVLGLLLMVGGQLHLPIGRLLGDIV